MSAWRIQSWILERYLDGWLPIPAPLMQLVLNVTVETYFRFAPALDVLPDRWSGGAGALTERGEDLMRIHYDKPAVLFENLLGPSMKYSMALWERGAGSLEEAQDAMLGDLCAKAGIRDGDRILDIGCGFGSFAAHALGRYPRSKVVGITLSDVQYRYITAKQGEPGHLLHDDRFRVIKADFTDVEFDTPFDRIISIGVFEHIANLRLALEKVSRLLAPGGTALLHFISYRRIIEAVANPKRDGFFGRYIFPGGRFWAFNELPRYQQHLRVEKSWYLSGANYCRTLQAWRSNFWRNIEAVRADPGLDERFVRMWDLYLRFCIAIFRSGGGRFVGNGQYLLRHAEA